MNRRTTQYSILISLFLLHSLMLNPCLSKTKASSELFPDIKGWEKSKEIQIYTPQNLYEYINGAAELYLSYDFQELQVAEYLNRHNVTVIAEIYRHKTPVRAFGIYSQERPIEGNFLKIGAQGYVEEPILNFVVGNAYVKINSYDVGEETGEVLQTFANKVAANLGGKGSLPKILTCFPEEGKRQNSERFIARSFLGHGFLHSGFIADYDVNNSHFQLFIIEGADSKVCEEMLKQYVQLTGSAQEDLKEGRYTLSDPYHGKVALSWKGQYIWGVLNLDEENLRTKYLRRMEELYSVESINNNSEKKEKTISVNGVDIVMVYIPAGEFLMGSPETEALRQSDEGPQHRVVINKGFWMGKYEVTQGQWIAVMGQNEAWFEEGNDYPVEWLSCDMAQGFIKKLNEKTGLKFRLPAESEWEYACRAGTTTPFHYGESISSDQANFNGKFPYGEAKKGVYREETCPVGSFQPNPWGVYDMHGKVWEWCEDVYKADIYNHPEFYTKNDIGNPVYSGVSSQRVFRGGGWLGNGVVLRSASRSHELRQYALPFIGFRLVLDD